VFPLKDNIKTRRFPVVTLTIIAICTVTWFVFEASLWNISETGDERVLEYGAIPYEITHPGEDCGVDATGTQIVCEGQPDVSGTAPDQAPWWVTIFTSMFMHGSFLHLAGNMLFLWIFGNNIEDSMGRPRFLLFYVLAGLVAVYAQALVDPASTVPTIGASGAVAGVLGGYALLHPGARVLTLIFLVFFVTLIEVPAVIVLGIWFLLQFLPAIGQTAITDLAGGDNVAYLAHVGGFVFGLATIKLFVTRARGRLTGSRTGAPP
jgi:membrane associated rhomboid family serine protease